MWISTYQLHSIIKLAYVQVSCMCDTSTQLVVDGLIMSNRMKLALHATGLHVDISGQAGRRWLNYVQ